jgi:hypothetical protein
MQGENDFPAELTLSENILFTFVLYNNKEKKKGDNF